MSDDIPASGPETVIRGQTAESPPLGKANSLRLVLIQGHTLGAPPLMLHGSFNISVDITGRYSGGMPGPILLVAVSHETGRVYMHHLVREDDLPSRYLGDAAPPAITRQGPGGPSSAGISEGGYFRVDLEHHLGLPPRADVYDLFLWLGDTISDLVTATKPNEPGGVAGGGALYGRSPTIAVARSAPGSDRLSLSWEQRLGARYVVGHCGRGRVSIIAHSIQSDVSGWTVLGSEFGGGIEFEIDVQQLLPGFSLHDRIVVTAISAGRRTELVDIPPLAIIQ